MSEAGADVANGPIALVHLALKSYGVAPFRTFMQSYRRHPAGVDHDLVIALKDFTGLDDAQEFLAEADGLAKVLLLVPSTGLDIGSYFHVADVLPRSAYFFTNSRAEIRADGYLASLSAALAVTRVGLVGATASYQSLASHYRWSLQRSGWPDWLWRLLSTTRAHLAMRSYPPFPNPHLRSNAILIRREILMRLTRPAVRAKSDAMRFESGWNSLTRQISAMGLDVRLVDGAGRRLSPSDWPAADVFWQGEQTELMIADNQTERYAHAGSAERAALRAYAWVEPPALFSADDAGDRDRVGSPG